MMTVIILSGVLVVTLGASEIVKLGLRMGRTQLNSTKAFFAAETAAEQVLQEVWKNNIYLERLGAVPCVADDWVNFTNAQCAGVEACCVGSPKIYALTDSNYGVIYNKTGNDVTFRAIGSSTDIQRIMEISYCQPIDCAGLECGDNGCGGFCGDCGPNANCVANNCVCTANYQDCEGICDCDDGPFHCDSGACVSD